MESWGIVLSQGTNLSVDAQTYTDDQIVAMFLATFSRSRYTLRNYTRAIEQFRRFIGTRSLRDVTWREIELYKLGLMQGYCSQTRKAQSPASVASLLAPLRSLYKWGSDPNIGIFEQNPTTCVKTPKISVNSKNHYVTKRELILLLNQLKRQGHRDYLIGLTLVLLGLRVSELVAIQWRHFHTDPAEKAMWLTVAEGKGGKYREVKVPSMLWNLFVKHLSSDPRNQSQPRKERRLFPLSVRQVERIIEKARKQSGLEKKVTPHWLRHTNATLALLQGASLQQVQETLGHAQINTTQRYLHTVEQLEKAAPDYVEDCLRDFLVSDGDIHVSALGK